MIKGYITKDSAETIGELMAVSAYWSQPAEIPAWVRAERAAASVLNLLMHGDDYMVPPVSRLKHTARGALMALLRFNHEDRSSQSAMSTLSVLVGALDWEALRGCQADILVFDGVLPRKDEPGLYLHINPMHKEQMCGRLQQGSAPASTLAYTLADAYPNASIMYAKKSK